MSPDRDYCVIPDCDEAPYPDHELCPTHEQEFGAQREAEFRRLCDELIDFAEKDAIPMTPEQPTTPAQKLRVLERELLKAEHAALRIIGELGKGGQHAGSPRLYGIEEVRRAMRQLAREMEHA